MVTRELSRKEKEGISSSANKSSLGSYGKEEDTQQENLQEIIHNSNVQKDFAPPAREEGVLTLRATKRKQSGDKDIDSQDSDSVFDEAIDVNASVTKSTSNLSVVVRKRPKVEETNDNESKSRSTLKAFFSLSKKF